MNQGYLSVKGRSEDLNIHINIDFTIVLNDFELRKSLREHSGMLATVCPFFLEHMDMWLSFSGYTLAFSLPLQIPAAELGSGQSTGLTNHGWDRERPK